MSGERVLTRRELNRALLARQMLLARDSRSVADAVEWLVGLQGQTPISPYVALWSRLRDFDSGELAALLLARRAVRIGLMRGTIHLVTTRDALALRPLLQAVHDATWRSSGFRKQLEGVDLAAVLEASREALEDTPRSPAELGTLLAARWPDRDRSALSYASRFLLPLVQVPPRGIWGTTSAARHTTLEAWTGQQVAQSTAADDVVLRYLAAFGPATVADIRTWSWLTGLRGVVERLRPRLRTFRDERGRELFDVLDGPLPDADTPAPPRFLPDYDNLVLSHDDRTRVVPVPIPQNVTWRWGSLLVDGFVAGTWKIGRVKKAARLAVLTFEPLSSSDAADVTAEGERLLAFMAADATPAEVTIATDPDQMHGRTR